MPTSGQLNSLLMGELNNNQPFQAGAQAITDQTNTRVQDFLSRLATTGLGRTGIGGAGLNQIYSNSGKQFGNLAASSAQNRTNIISQLLGLHKFDKQFEQNKLGFGDVFGSILGLGAGSILGPAGGAIGAKLGGLITGD